MNAELREKIKKAIRSNSYELSTTRFVLDGNSVNQVVDDIDKILAELQNNVSSSRHDSWWNLLSENEREAIMDNVVKKYVSEEYSNPKPATNPPLPKPDDKRNFHELAAEKLGLRDHDFEKEMKEKKNLILLRDAVEWWAKVTSAAKKEMCHEAFDSSSFVEHLSEKAVMFLYENYSHKLTVGNILIVETILPEDTSHSQVM